MGPHLMTDTAIAVLPYGQSLGAHLAQVSLDSLFWPLGRPKKAVGCVDDLGPKDHLLVFPKTSMHTKLRWGTRAKVSVMMVEPRMIHARHLNMLRLSYRRFHRVFTHDALTLQRLPNARFLAAASTWVPEYADLQIDKTANVSLIASARADQDGHQLRHAIVDAVRAKGLDVDIMGRAYRPFDKKSEGLAPYRYSVVIENTRSLGYFTEKLVDALLCETIPIYWGAPDIADHFDTSGMIVCETHDQIMAALRNADTTQYTAMKPALMRAKDQAIALRDYQLSAAKMLRDDA
jgi:hypothetical protein